MNIISIFAFFVVVNVFTLIIFAQNVTDADVFKKLESHSNETPRRTRQAGGAAGGAGVAPVFNILGQTLGSALGGAFQGFSGLFGRPGFGQGIFPTQQGFGQGIFPAQQGFGQGNFPPQQGFGQGNFPAQQGFGQGNFPAQQGFGQGNFPSQQGSGNPFQNFFQSIPETFGSANFRPTNNMGNFRPTNNMGNINNSPGSNGFTSSSPGISNPGNNGISSSSGNNDIMSNAITPSSDIYDPANDHTNNVNPASDSIENNAENNLLNSGPVTFNRPNFNPTRPNLAYASNYGSYFPGSPSAVQYYRRRRPAYSRPPYYMRVRYQY